MLGVAEEEEGVDGDEEDEELVGGESAEGECVQAGEEAEGGDAKILREVCQPQILRVEANDGDVEEDQISYHQRHVVQIRVHLNPSYHPSKVRTALLSGLGEVAKR